MLYFVESKSANPNLKSSLRKLHLLAIYHPVAQSRRVSAGNAVASCGALRCHVQGHGRACPWDQGDQLKMSFLRKRLEETAKVAMWHTYSSKYDWYNLFGPNFIAITGHHHDVTSRSLKDVGDFTATNQPNSKYLWANFSPMPWTTTTICPTSGRSFSRQ